MPDMVIHAMTTIGILTGISGFFPLNDLAGNLICLFFRVSLFVNVIMDHSVVEFVWVKGMAQG